MTTISRKLSAAPKPLKQVGMRLGRDKVKWARGGLIAIVIAYVGLIILAPLVALAFGALERGAGAIVETFENSVVLRSFWNTLWISLIVVIGCFFAANDDRLAWHDQWAHTAVCHVPRHYRAFDAVVPPPLPPGHQPPGA